MNHHFIGLRFANFTGMFSILNLTCSFQWSARISLMEGKDRHRTSNQGLYTMSHTSHLQSFHPCDNSMWGWLSRPHLQILKKKKWERFRILRNFTQPVTAQPGFKPTCSPLFNPCLFLCLDTGCVGMALYLFPTCILAFREHGDRDAFPSIISAPWSTATGALMVSEVSPELSRWRQCPQAWDLKMRTDTLQSKTEQAGYRGLV